MLRTYLAAPFPAVSRHSTLKPDQMITRALATASLKPIILSILADGESYGYQLIQRIEQLSDGRMEWTTGTLYPFLHGLENDGLVKSRWESVENAPRRKYYALTTSGATALAEQKEQWLTVNRILVRLWGPSPELSWS